MNYAGLDVGTTGVKALVVNHRGDVVASSYEKYPMLMPRKGWSELDPEQIWDGCRKVLKDVTDQTRGDFEALAVSSHAQSVALLDKDGRTLCNFISTVDGRTDRELEFWRRTGREWEMYQRTGLPFSHIYTANKLMWLKANRPEIFGQAARFMCVQDYVNWRLTGRAVIDYSLAGRGMLLNGRERRWDREILELIGIDRASLLELLEAGTVIGRVSPSVAKELHLRPELLVVSGGHDQMCGCLGSGVIHAGQIMNSSGTVEVMEALSPWFVTDEEILKYHFPCTPYITGDHYLIMSINNSGGLMLWWYLNTFCSHEKALAEVNQQDPYTWMIGESADEISDVYVLPHLNGAETPVQDPDSACAIVHMGADTSKADITRGLLDSMAYELRLNLEAFKSLGCGAYELRAIGGGARTPKLLQIKADVLQIPVITLASGESAALGAAMIGAVGIGAFPGYEAAIGSMVHISHIYEPDRRKASEYNEHFEEYKLLYPALAGFNKRISKRMKDTRR